MNCIKCNASIPKSKTFCPNCGHFNEAAKTGVPESRLHFAVNRNILALIGSVLLIISFIMPFYKFQSTENADKTSGFSALIYGTRGTIVTITNGDFGATKGMTRWGKDYGRLHLNESFLFGAVIADILNVITLSGWLILFGSAITIYFASVKHVKTVQTSFLTAICGFFYLLRFFFTFIQLAGSKFAYAFDIGFAILLIAVICLLIPAVTAFFDKKSLVT